MIQHPACTLAQQDDRPGDARLVAAHVHLAAEEARGAGEVGQGAHGFARFAKRRPDHLTAYSTSTKSRPVTKAWFSQPSGS